MINHWISRESIHFQSNLPVAQSSRLWGSGHQLLLRLDPLFGCRLRLGIPWKWRTVGWKKVAGNHGSRNSFYLSISLSLSLCLFGDVCVCVSQVSIFGVVCFCFFPRFLPSVGYFKETGMNHRQSCQSAFGSAVKHQ